MSDVYEGCLDGNCLLRITPVHQHTNGGCRCLQDIPLPLRLGIKKKLWHQREEVERLQLEDSQLHTECGHLRADAVELQAEIERLNDEISYYESLTADECQDWPHRDGRYREWLCSRLREQLEKFEELRRERDEAREAARWLMANLDHAAEYDVETTAERRWPWLREVEDE